MSILEVGLFEMYYLEQYIRGYNSFDAVLYTNYVNKSVSSFVPLSVMLW